MNGSRLLLVSSLLVGLGGAVAVACGDDDAIVRERPDGGTTTDSAVIDGEAGTDAALACGVTVPTTFDATSYATNAAVELALKGHLEDIENKMREGDRFDGGPPPAASDLTALFSAGTPSLRAVSTSNTQTLVDQNIAFFGAAVGQTWTPDLAAADGGAATGGRYGNFLFSPVGVDLREATVKGIITGGLYNHALGIVSAPLTPATPDRLLALFGASPSLANRTDADAGDLADELVAEYASRRDNDNAPTGTYRKIAQALLTLKVSIAAGDKCKSETDAAIATYFAEWEKAELATSIFYLNSAVTNAISGDNTKFASALHGYGEALGFIQLWKGIPQEKRKITDAQVDALLAKIGADSPYKLITETGTRGIALNGAINDIAIIYGFSAAEVEAFKVNF